MVASKGLRDTFSEEQILLHYRRPAQGRSRYAFVHWAHRLAGASAQPAAHSSNVPENTKDDPLGKEGREGLAFILSWSIARILLVLLLVSTLSTAAALLWIFLGRSTTEAWPPKSDFRNAGDRVGTGMVIGICVLLLGLSSMAGWLGASWLIM